MDAAVRPGKMLVPVLGTRIEERNYFAGDVVKGVGFGPFELVTTITGRGQIFPLMTTASRLRDDVVNDQGYADEPTGGAAIFTAMICFGKDLLPNHLWNGRHGHSNGNSFSAGTE